ncbi:MAG TPA: glycosyltransferase 87 family protein [Nocardioides sp.]|uniref:glycosyltransferase family 87 protein n=1 Tax=Nocardioides sp. TaxID=35761 RepID=UPI002E35FAED|nr:glycosyltransferase 87 family protein [Nocardioides sp.]HEX5087474.1 glycosyltransferase 87 family protein [Nocardioides sp.]
MTRLPEPPGEPSGKGSGGRGDHVHPTLDDPVVTALSEGVGGPFGRRSAGHPWWTPVRVLVLMAAVCFALGMVQKSGCYQGHWANEDRYTHMCYSDLPYLYTGRGLVELDWPFSDDPQVRARYEVMEYPVGIAYFAYGAAWVTQKVTGAGDVSTRADQPTGDVAATGQVQKELRGFVIVNTLVFAALAILSAWLLAGVNPRRPWDAAIFAASPTLLLTGIINWDMLAVVFVAGALFTWARDRPLATGVLIGIGTATKLYPLFLLGPIAIICLRQRRYRDLVDTVLAAAASWFLLNAPAYLSGRAEWMRFWEFNSERGPDLGSGWLVLSQIRETTISAGTVNHWSWALFGLWCVAVAVVGLRAPSTPRLAQLGFLVVAGFLLVNKVYSPQYVLWLLPLAALARPRWRDQLVWQACEVFYFASVWWYLQGDLQPSEGQDVGFYWVAVIVRMLGELYLVAMVTRDVLRPEHDVVEREPDPPQPISTRSNVVAV